MKEILIAASFLLPAEAFPQAQPDELDASLQKLAERLAKDGPSVRLAELARSEHGRQAIREKIEFLVSVGSGRFERDPQGHYEDYLFARTETGDLALRPERRPEIELLRREMARAPRAMATFSRRCDELAQKIDDSTELGKRAKAAWLDPQFRIAFFHKRAGEVRESEEDELLEAFVSRGLERGQDGKLRPAGPYRQEVLDRVRAIATQQATMREYEKAYLRVASRVKEEAARNFLVSEPALLLILGRVVRQATEGSQTNIGGLMEKDPENPDDKGVSFNLELPELVDDVKAAQKLAHEIQPALEKTAGEIAPEGDEAAALVDFLRNGRARLLLAERITAARADQKMKGEAVFDAVEQDGFEPAGDRLRVKKGRYVDDNKNESLEVLESEIRAPIDEFNGVRAAFDGFAERCMDPALVELFENRSGTFLLQEHMARVTQNMIEAVRRRGIEIFTKLYLSSRGDQLAVRAERARRVDEMAKRAEEIRKEKEGQK